MSFLIEASEEDIVSGKAFREYTAYLDSLREQLPLGVYALATATWYYDFTNRKCLHDAWIQEISVKEITEGETAQTRKTQIEILLLGAYHDRLQKLTYSDVTAYSFRSTQAQDGHGDWLLDEVSLSSSGLVVHEVKLRFNAFLKIECHDFCLQEQLTNKPYEAIWQS